MIAKTTKEKQSLILSYISALSAGAGKRPLAMKNPSIKRGTMMLKDLLTLFSKKRTEFTEECDTIEGLDAMKSYVIVFYRA